MGMMVSLVIQFLYFFFAKTQSYHPLFSFPTCLFLLSILPQQTHLVTLSSIDIHAQDIQRQLGLDGDIPHAQGGSSSDATMGLEQIVCPLVCQLLQLWADILIEATADL